MPQSYDDLRSSVKVESVRIFQSVENSISRPCLSLKSSFFASVYWFVNLTLKDKHGFKKLTATYLPLRFQMEKSV